MAALVQPPLERGNQGIAPGLDGIFDIEDVLPLATLFMIAYAIALIVNFPQPKDQLDRIKRLGVVPSFFVVHTYFWGDRHYEMFLGQDRAERISPLRSALKRGIPFSNHNDTFVTPIDPLLSVWSAVNRRTSGGRILGENQTIPVMDALRSVTSWAAYQACEERIKGSLEPGKLADFVILEANPLTVAKETIKDIGISATIVGDEVVYGSLD